MMNGYDIAYTFLVAITAPFWLIKSSARNKVLTALSQRVGHVPTRSGNAPAVLIHAVSLGEINATSALVTILQQARPDLQIIISTTTKTGYERGQQLYGSKPNTMLVRFPLDFSSAINRFLDSTRPAVAVLMELEIWPNFLKQCERRKIPVALINGRMTPTAFERYRMARFVTARMFRRLTVICAQDETYSERFGKLGAPTDRIQVSGTMKFDTAQVMKRVPGDEKLAEEVALRPGEEPIWVCGSTGPGEEAIILEAYRNLLGEFPKLRLVIVPRKPERFDEVAQLIERTGCELIRRSKGQITAAVNPVILGDTMGELRKFYSLANIVFVGRSLVDLGSKQHGSDMIEPAALAKPIIVGPWTNNFAEPMRKLKAANAVKEVSNQSELEQTIRSWLADSSSATEMGTRAQQVVRQNQGATERHAEIILKLLHPAQSTEF